MLTREPVVPERRLLEHPAVKAWQTLCPNHPEPKSVEALKERTKSAVFRLAGVGPAGSPVIAKRCRPETALVERTLYEEVLPRLPLSAICYHGFVEDANAECTWLFLEDAGGAEYSPSLKDHRSLAALWLGTMHIHTAQAKMPACLPERVPEHYREHLQAARARIMGNLANPSLQDEHRLKLRTLVSRWDDLDACWARMDGFATRLPPTLVHGDFVPKNLRVRTGSEGTHLLVFDWEVAGWGLPAADLAECPDLSAYWSVVQQTWPHAGFEGIKQMAYVGKIFQVLTRASWVSCQLAYEWVERHMPRVKYYAAEMEDLLKADGWGEPEPQRRPGR